MTQTEMDGLAARARIVAEQLHAAGTMSLTEYLNILAIADGLSAVDALNDSRRPNRVTGGAG